MKKWKSIFIGAVMSIFLTSCIDEESAKTNINEEMIQGDILKENKTKFLEKTVSMMGEGGWLYYLTEIKTVSGENTDIAYEFDGIQMWEEIVENCYAPVIGEDGSIVDKISPRVPTLYYLEGAKEEVENIQECLNENQDKKTLFLELEKLKLTWISSEKLQELYEKLQKTVYQEEMGRYGEISYTDKITVPLKNKEKLSFTYLLDFGNIGCEYRNHQQGWTIV